MSGLIISETCGPSCYLFCLTEGRRLCWPQWPITPDRVMLCGWEIKAPENRLTCCVVHPWSSSRGEGQCKCLRYWYCLLYYTLKCSHAGCPMTTYKPDRSTRQRDGGHLEKETAFMWSEVTLEYLPQPADHTVAAVKTSIVLRVPPTNDIINHSSSSSSAAAAAAAAITYFNQANSCK